MKKIFWKGFFLCMILIAADLHASCNDTSGDCIIQETNQHIASLSVGCCWVWKDFGCKVCHDSATLNEQCNSQLPACEGKCVMANVGSCGGFDKE